MEFGKVNYRIYPFSNLILEEPKLWLEHKEHTYHFGREIFNKINDEVLHLFPLSQIPLLIYLGYILQNDNKIYVYQKNEDQAWVLGNKDAEILEIKCFKVNVEHKTPDLIVIIEASGKINNSDVDFHISTAKNDVIRISIDNPERFSVLYESQVKDFKNFIRKNIEPTVSNYDKIHLFVAVPAGFAVEIGRIILRSTWPKIVLYNYRHVDNPKYKIAFTINE